MYALSTLLHMYLLAGISWETYLFGNEDWTFIFDVVVRTIIMFAVVLVSLRLLGKRGIKQLSVFELGVIIALGSAAGDPMFYKDVGIVFGLMVFLVVVLLYRLLTFFIEQSDRVEKIVEGKPHVVVKDGKLLFENMEKESLSHAELYAQLRMNHVSHLGQISLAILETTGEVSIFYYEDNDVKPGLPIIPFLYEDCLKHINEAAIYACHTCGSVKELLPADETTCNVCQGNTWNNTLKEKRIT